MAVIVAAGDFHIPHRAEKIPEAFYQAIERIRPDYVALTGDYTEEHVYQEVTKKIKEISPKTVIVAVRGNMDTFKTLPLEDIIDLTGGRVIGVIHGHQIYPRGDLQKLYNYANERGRKILIHGHTHTFSVDVPLPSDILLVNPGTLTGARGGLQLGMPEKTFAEIRAVPKKVVEVKQWEIVEDNAEVVGVRRIRI